MPGTEPTSSIVAASHVIQRPMPSIRGEKDRAARDSSLHVPIDRKLFPESTHDVEPVAGTRLGHFVIEEQIGRGGMGAVFRAVDQRLNRIVALKVLAPDQSRDPAAVQRFMNEARAAARLDHENIARVFFIGEDQGLQFIAFEFVTGTNVREFLHIRGKLPVEEAVNYTLQVALALRHTAAAGVVHRDIKPSNIVISPTGRAKLVDLGLARTQAVEGEELTVAGTALGTFDYISPEQARDPRLVDVRSDIYSLGCTLYHMLTGEPPFPQGTMFEKVIEHHGSRPPDPSLKNPGVSPQLARLVQRMMASRPEERYATPDLLIQDLVDIAQSMGLRATAPDSPVWITPLYDHPGFWEANRGWVLTLAVLVLIALFVDRFPWQPTTPGNPTTASSGQTLTDDTNNTASVLSNDGSAASNDIEDTSDDVPENDAIPYDYQLSTNTQDPAGHPATLSHAQIEHGSITGSSGTGGLGAGVFSGSMDASEGIAANTPRNPGIGRPQTTNPRGNNTNANDTETTTNNTPPAATANAYRVVVGGVPMGSYPTLEAACVAAPDNAVIEVTGTSSTPLRESRIRIVQKRLTIQATGGGRPVIEFSPAEVGLITSYWNCVEVVDGALTLSGLDLIVRAPNGSITSVFSLVRSRELTLSEATLTLVNPAGAPAQVIDLPLPSSAERMEMMATDVLEIDVSYSLVRGVGSFLVNRSESSVDARFQQTAVALSEDFFRMECSGQTRMDQVAEGAECRVEFDHCTTLLGRNLLNLSVPMEARIPRIQFAVDDSIVWINSGSEPMIAMQGDKEMDELMDLFDWQGYINHIHVTAPWWVIDAPFSTVGTFESWTDREWRDNWRDADDQTLAADVLPVQVGGRWASVQLADLMLQMGEETPALSSSDGRMPGVDWTQGPIPTGFPRVP